MSAISRTQAWCKLVVLIADGLPAPKEIRVSDRVVSITLDDLAGFDRWMKHFNARLDQPFRGAGRTLHEALTDWEGYLLSLKAHVPFAAPDTKPTTEDMARVREMAAGRELRCEEYDGPHEPHDGHVYACCGKVGRISRHESWCETNVVARAVSGE